MFLGAVYESEGGKWSLTLSCLLKRRLTIKAALGLLCCLGSLCAGWPVNLLAHPVQIFFPLHEEEARTAETRLPFLGDLKLKWLAGADMAKNTFYVL